MMNANVIPLSVRWVAVALSASVCVAAVPYAPAADHPAPTRADSSDSNLALGHYTTMQIEGWTVHVNDGLNKADRSLSQRVLELLRHQLYQIARRVPDKALARLREVPIWVEHTSPKVTCACYHPNAGWLRDNGYDPVKVKSVEIGNAENFLKWTVDQPWMVLHELAHAYHDRVLPGGYDNPDILAAYQEAMKAKLYGEMLHISGKPRLSYAANNQREYFAEATEAFFGTNDFYPFVRVELRQHDPVLFRLLERLWSGEVSVR
jgi:hypothetical protein